MYPMIDPEIYVQEYLAFSYEELIPERDRLLALLKRFENNELREEDLVDGVSPEESYRMELIYYAEVCKMLAEQYSKKLGKECPYSFDKERADYSLESQASRYITTPESMSNIKWVSRPGHDAE